MRLQEILNKFSGSNFNLSVRGMCKGIPFWAYDDLKKKDCWRKYKNRKVKCLDITTSNGWPELCITVEEREQC